MKRRCPQCSSETISLHQLALFRRPRCPSCGWRIGFKLVFELAFHFFTNMPIALLALFLVLTHGAIVGIVAGLVVLLVFAYLAARIGPLDVRGLRQRPSDS